MITVEDNSEQRRGKKDNITSVKDSEEAVSRHITCNDQLDWITVDSVPNMTGKQSKPSKK